MPELLRRKLPAILLCSWCLALLLVRMLYSGTHQYSFMIWNLFLAVVPVVAAALFRLTAELRTSRVFRWAWWLVWLAFLPNAPYLVTDLIHLQSFPPVPLWYDVVVLGSFAATGLFLTYMSVADVESVLRRQFGTLVALAVSYGSLALCGFGIYLGRFMRWNSWDLVTSPASLFADVAQRFTDPLSHSRTWAVTVLYGVGLIVGYVVLQAVAASLHDSDTPSARRPARRSHSPRNRTYAERASDRA